MPRMKTDGKSEQATFDFDAATSAQVAVGAIAETTAVYPAHWAEVAPVVILDDRRRARHLEVVRRLLAETGVFKAD